MLSWEGGIRWNGSNISHPSQLPEDAEGAISPSCLKHILWTGPTRGKLGSKSALKKDPLPCLESTGSTPRATPQDNCFGWGCHIDDRTLLTLPHAGFLPKRWGHSHLICGTIRWSKESLVTHEVAKMRQGEFCLAWEAPRWCKKSLASSGEVLNKLIRVYHLS